MRCDAVRVRVGVAIGSHAGEEKRGTGRILDSGGKVRGAR
jgi:hypothetical protein